MKALALWLRCIFIKGHDYEFVSVLPGRGYGGATACFQCTRCGGKRFAR